MWPSYVGHFPAVLCGGFDAAHIHTQHSTHVGIFFCFLRLLTQLNVNFMLHWCVEESAGHIAQHQRFAFGTTQSVRDQCPQRLIGGVAANHSSLSEPLNCFATHLLRYLVLLLVSIHLAFKGALPVPSQYWAMPCARAFCHRTPSHVGWLPWPS